jgi:hypothetical protein
MRVVHNYLIMNDIHKGSGDKTQAEQVVFHTEKDFSTV